MRNWREADVTVAVFLAPSGRPRRQPAAWVAIFDRLAKVTDQEEQNPHENPARRRSRRRHHFARRPLPSGGHRRKTVMIGLLSPASGPGRSSSATRLRMQAHAARRSTASSAEYRRRPTISTNSITAYRSSRSAERPHLLRRRAPNGAAPPAARRRSTARARAAARRRSWARTVDAEMDRLCRPS